MARVRESLFDRWFLVGLLVILLIFGGSARIDSAGLLIVRLVSLLAIMVALPLWWTQRGDSRWTAIRPVATLLGLFALLILIQLAPLPPALWAALPGHGELADKMRSAGVDIGWRPLALVPSRAWHALFDLLPPFAVWLALGRTSDRTLGKLPLYLMYFLGFAGALGILQLLAGTENGLYFHRITNVGSAVGFFANRNHHAMLLALYWPVLLFYLFGSKDRVATNAAIILGHLTGGLILLAIIASGSRAGLALGGVSFAVGTYLLWRWRAAAVGTEGAAQIVRWLLLASIVGGIIVAFLVLALGEKFLDRIGQQDVIEDLRFAVLPTLTGLVRDYAPFGAGFGSFEVAYQIVEPVSLLRLNYLNHAHNDGIELLIDGGLPALALLLGWIGLVWRAARRGWADEQTVFADRAGIAAMVFVLILLWTGSVTDYPLRTPAVASIAMLATALLHRFPLVASAKNKAVRHEGRFR